MVYYIQGFHTLLFYLFLLKYVHLFLLTFIFTFTYFFCQVSFVIPDFYTKVLSMTLQLDSDGNLIYSQTGFTYYSQINALLQDLTCRLRLFNNEYKLADEGLDYPTLLNNNNETLIHNNILTEIHKDHRVSYVTIKQRQSKPHSLSLDIYIKSEL